MMNFKIQIEIFTVFLFLLILPFSGFSQENSKLDSLLKLELNAIKDTNKVNLLTEIAEIYIEDNFVNALKYGEKANRLASSLKFEKGRIEALIIICNANDYLGRYAEAQKYNLELLTIFNQMGDSNSISTCNNNIGIIHYYLGNYNESIKYTKKALSYYKSIKDTNGISICYNNIANSYSDIGENLKALEYYFKALELDEKMNDLAGVCLIKGNIGEVYTETGDYDKSYSFIVEALQIAEKLEDKWQQANMYSALGRLLTKQNLQNEALGFLRKAVPIYKGLGANAEMVEVYEDLSIVMERMGDLQQSLSYLKKAKELNDEIYNKENAATIAEMNALYEIQEKENQLLKQEALAEHQESQKKMIIIAGSIVLLLLLIIISISVKGNINKRRVNATLENQKLQIETKNRDITDSIQYAKRIQGAILPSENFLNQYLPESFVLYLPKDIVAGDFYWLHPSKDEIIFAVADCTGHGVPGAMVSVVCNNALNRAVREFNINSPARILDKVRELVIETFEKSDTNIKDGMDIALCKLSKTSSNWEIEYAGANNPLWIINPNRNKWPDNVLEFEDELNGAEIKANKQPIGKFMNKEPFTNHKVKLEKGDKIYILTDGYPDQFGGEKGKKYKYKRLKTKLNSIYSLSLEKQKEELVKEFNLWKGDLEQIDDVCIMGIKI